MYAAEVLKGPESGDSLTSATYSVSVRVRTNGCLTDWMWAAGSFGNDCYLKMTVLRVLLWVFFSTFYRFTFAVPLLHSVPFDPSPWPLSPHLLFCTFTFRCWVSPFLPRNEVAGWRLWAKRLLKQRFSRGALQTEGYEMCFVKLQLQRPILPYLNVFFSR